MHRSRLPNDRAISMGRPSNLSVAMQRPWALTGCAPARMGGAPGRTRQRAAPLSTLACKVCPEHTIEKRWVIIAKTNGYCVGWRHAFDQSIQPSMEWTSGIICLPP